MSYRDIKSITIDNSTYQFDNPNLKKEEERNFLHEGSTCYVVEGKDENNSRILVKIAKHYDNDTNLTSSNITRLEQSFDQCNIINQNAGNDNYFLEWNKHDDGVYYTALRTVSTLEYIMNSRNANGNIYDNILSYLYGIARILKQLERLHKAGYVHIDIKETNILFINAEEDESTGLDNYGWARLIDFDASYSEGVIKSADKKELEWYSSCKNDEIENRKESEIYAAKTFDHFIIFDLRCVIDMIATEYQLLCARYNEKLKTNEFNLLTEMLLNELNIIMQSVRKANFPWENASELCQYIDGIINYYKNNNYKDKRFENTSRKDIIFNIAHFIHKEKINGIEKTTYEIYRKIDNNILPSMESNNTTYDSTAQKLILGEKIAFESNGSALYQILKGNADQNKYIYLGEGGLGKSTALIKFFVEQNRRAIYNDKENICMLFNSSDCYTKSKPANKYHISGRLIAIEEFGIIFICDAYNENQDFYSDVEFSKLNNIVVSMRDFPSDNEAKEHGFSEFSRVEMQGLSDDQVEKYIQEMEKSAKDRDDIYRLKRSDIDKIDRKLLSNTMVLLIAVNSIKTINDKVINIIREMSVGNDAEADLIYALSENKVYGKLVCHDEGVFATMREVINNQSDFEKLSKELFVECQNATDIIANYITMKPEDIANLDMLMQKAFECVMETKFEIKITKEEYDKLISSTGKAFNIAVKVDDSGEKEYKLTFLHQNYRDVLCAMCYAEAFEYFNNENEKIDAEIEKKWVDQGLDLEELRQFKDIMSESPKNIDSQVKTSENKHLMSKYKELYNETHLAKRKAIFKGLSKEDVKEGDSKLESIIDEIERNAIKPYEERIGENLPGTLRYLMDPMEIDGEVMRHLGELIL